MKNILPLKEMLFWLVFLSSTLIVFSGCPDQPEPQPGNLPEIGNYYVQYEQQPEYLVTAVSATILTKYGVLFDHGDSTRDDLSLAYCAAARVRSNYNDTIWAQMGFATHRPKDFILTFHAYYCEIMGDRWNMWYSSFPDGFPNPDSLLPPVEGWYYNYSCELNTETGHWDFRYDYDLVDTRFINHEVWKLPATYVSWSTEINNVFHDMPGTESDPCKFWNLQYRRKYDNSWIFPKRNETENAWASDPNEWGIKVITVEEIIDTVKIWDFKPL